MTSIWAECLGRALGQALDLLTAAVRDCPGELWESPMWPVQPLPPGQQFLGPDWNPTTDPEQVALLTLRWVERRSTPWSVAWHALECFDYDLSGEFEPWTPPPPFAGHPHWRDLPSLPVAWTRTDLLDYVEHCRQRARTVLAGLTDAKAATPLPATHRYAGQPYASLLTSIPLHPTEHAAQVRQFVADATTRPQP